MLNSERSKQILQFLKTKKSATVNEIAKELYVSPATIRRDLNEMQKLGQIERSHGGAIIMENADEISIFVRQSKNAKDKELVAAIALKHLPNYKTVFIDNSSTCLALAERMNFSNKIVVTNGLEVASKIAKKNNVTLLMPGGEIKSNTSALTGSFATSSLQRFKFDLMLTSCSSVDKNGSYEFSLESSQIKRTALWQAKTRILLFDKNKLNVNASFRSAKLSEYDVIITNAELELIQHLIPDGVSVYNK